MDAPVVVEQCKGEYGATHPSLRVTEWDVLVKHRGRQVGREPCFVAASPRFGVRFDGGCVAGSLRAQSIARQ